MADHSVVTAVTPRGLKLRLDRLDSSLRGQADPLPVNKSIVNTKVRISFVAPPQAKGGSASTTGCLKKTITSLIQKSSKKSFLPPPG